MGDQVQIWLATFPRLIPSLTPHYFLFLCYLPLNKSDKGLKINKRKIKVRRVMLWCVTISTRGDYARMDVWQGDF